MVVRETDKALHFFLNERRTELLVEAGSRALDPDEARELLLLEQLLDLLKERVKLRSQW